MMNARLSRSSYDLVASRLYQGRNGKKEGPEGKGKLGTDSKEGILKQTNMDACLKWDRMEWEAAIDIVLL